MKGRKIQISNRKMELKNWRKLFHTLGSTVKHKLQLRNKILDTVLCDSRYPFSMSMFPVFEKIPCSSYNPNRLLTISKSLENVICLSFGQANRSVALSGFIACRSLSIPMIPAATGFS